MRRTRAQNVAEAQEMRAAGVAVKEIAARMGVHWKTVYEWLADPSGERSSSRKRADDARAIAQRACSECGGPVGTRRAGRCDPCFRRHLAERRAVVLALRNEGLMNVEIADRLGTTQQAVANILCRERKLGAPVRPTPYWERGRQAA
jgi:transposase